MTPNDLPPVIRTRVEAEAREASLRASTNPPGELVVVLDDCVLNNLDHRAFSATIGDVVEVPAGSYANDLIQMGLVIRASDLESYAETEEASGPVEATEEESTEVEPVPSSKELGLVVPEMTTEEALIPSRRGRPKTNGRK